MDGWMDGVELDWIGLERWMDGLDWIGQYILHKIFVIVKIE